MSPFLSEITIRSPTIRNVSVQIIDMPCNAESLYMEMLEEEENMEMRYNLTISVANWDLLANYLVVPDTFTILQQSSQIEKILITNNTGRAILHSILYFTYYSSFNILFLLILYNNNIESSVVGYCMRSICKRGTGCSLPIASA
jgi:hypothetical protein